MKIVGGIWGGELLPDKFPIGRLVESYTLRGAGTEGPRAIEIPTNPAFLRGDDWRNF